MNPVLGHKDAFEMSFDELIQGGVPTSVFGEVAVSIRDDENADRDMDFANREDEWHLIANQVVGHEDL